MKLLTITSVLSGILVRTKRTWPIFIIKDTLDNPGTVDFFSGRSGTLISYPYRAIFIGDRLIENSFTAVKGNDFLELRKLRG